MMFQHLKNYKDKLVGAGMKVGGSQTENPQRFLLYLPISRGSLGWGIGWRGTSAFVSVVMLPRHLLRACWKEAALSASL